MEQNELIKETVKYLNNISNRVGEKLTEYDWREACGLIAELDPNNDLYKEESKETFVEHFYHKLDNLIASNESLTLPLDFIFDTLDDFALADEFEKIDLILEKVNIQKYSVSMLIGFLTITHAFGNNRYPYKHRQRIVEYLRTTVLPEVFKGLE
jgi:hypothetical protein